MTKEEAIKLYESKWWKDKTPKEICDFQLYEDRLCMDFGDFQGAMEKCLGRPVWTHEFAFKDRMTREYEGKSGKPSFEDILNLIPEEKRILIITDPAS